jgi:hypothetical protein
MNRDFAEMLAALSAAGAEFLVVGAYALAAHGYPRATGDLDIWVRPSAENAERVWQALVGFGAPLHEITRADLHTPGIVFQIGMVPCRIDLLTSISGVSFDDAWSRRVVLVVAGVKAPFLSREDLIRNKRATGRTKDLADAEEIEKVPPS